MRLQFYKDRYSGSGAITAVDRNNVVLRKMHLKFFLMKNPKKVLPKLNQRCLRNTK